MAIPDLIHEFWFGNHASDVAVMQQQSRLWWSKKPEFDQEIRSRFEQYVQAAEQGEYDEWSASPKSLLALLLLTDQFPRSIYRGTAHAFSFDPIARKQCLAGLEKGLDSTLRPVERIFFYMPLVHSESVEHQERSVQLFTRLCQDAPESQIEQFRGYFNFALRHHHIIARFGRFPHRNNVLDRISTPEEIAFLKEPGSSF